MRTSKEEDRSSGRLRVCLLLPRLGIGGAETHVMQLAGHLDRSRFAVSLCCLKPGAADWEERARRIVESYTVLGFRMRYLPLAIVRLAAYLRRGRFDVLHCHLSLADVLGRLAGSIARVPVIITTEHGKHLWKSKPHLLLERILARATDLRICVSRDIVEIRRRREGTSEDKLAYIPNGVDPLAARRALRDRAAVMAEFGWDSGAPLILAVGRLVPAKSYATLVETVSLLGARVPAARCLIVGEGSCRDEVEAAIERFGVRGVVALAGARADIPDLLAAADVFALTSIREGLPVSLLEAMAAGKAIVATSVGGVPDAVTDGESGLMISPGDPAAAADAIARLLDDPVLRRSLGETAAKVAEERFSIDVVARRVGEAYQTLLACKGNRAGRKPVVARDD